MLAIQLATNSTKPIDADSNYPKMRIELSALVVEITDRTAEQVCAGSMVTPETDGAKEENDHTTPPAGWDGGIGLKPFLPTLPGTKLHRLGSLDPYNRPTPKNSITITVPLPVF